MHPLDVMTVGDETFNLGGFMSADSRLDEYKAFCGRMRALGGAVNLDEDNNASRYMDERGWTIHRQRAWIALLSGCHYDYIDFSVLAGRERSTPDGRRLLRSRFGSLAQFWEENHVWSTAPDDEVVVEVPAGCTAVAARGQGSYPGPVYVYIAAEVPNDLAVPFADRAVEGCTGAQSSASGLPDLLVRSRDGPLFRMGGPPQHGAGAVAATRDDERCCGCHQTWALIARGFRSPGLDRPWLRSPAGLDRRCLDGSN